MRWHHMAFTSSLSWTLWALCEETSLFGLVWLSSLKASHTIRSSEHREDIKKRRCIQLKLRRLKLNKELNLIDRKISPVTFQRSKITDGGLLIIAEFSSDLRLWWWWALLSHPGQTHFNIQTWIIYKSPSSSAVNIPVLICDELYVSSHRKTCMKVLLKRENNNSFQTHNTKKRDLVSQSPRLGHKSLCQSMFWIIKWLAVCFLFGVCRYTLNLWLRQSKRLNFYCYSIFDWKVNNLNRRTRSRWDARVFILYSLLVDTLLFTLFCFQQQAGRQKDFSKHSFAKYCR